MGHLRRVLPRNTQMRSKRHARQPIAMLTTTPPALSPAKEPIMPSLSVLQVHQLVHSLVVRISLSMSVVCGLQSSSTFSVLFIDYIVGSPGTTPSRNSTRNPPPPPSPYGISQYGTGSGVRPAASVVYILLLFSTVLFTLYSKLTSQFAFRMILL